MKIRRFLLALPLVILVFTSATNAQKNQREKFQFKYWATYVGSYQTSSGKFIVIGLAWNKNDKKVLPDVNRSIFEMTFAVAGNRDYAITIIPNMNHSLVVSKRGGRKEETPTRLAPGLISTRIQWLQSHLLLSKER